jgi:hypothetical protein
VISAFFKVPAACIARPDAAIALALPTLERAVGLEHRVQMADQQQLLAAPGMARHEVTGPARRLHVDPLHLEAQRLQLGADHVADLPDALGIERAAVLVDPLSEHAQRPFPLCVDSADHPGFGG